MKTLPTIAAVLSLSLVAACDSPAEKQADAAEDRMEQQADDSVAKAGPAPAALGLSEAQLLEADLVSSDGTELGDIQQIRRNPSGAVEAFVIEIENSNPDRMVAVPLAGLTTRVQGNDTDVVTKMTAQQLAALPDALSPGR